MSLNRRESFNSLAGPSLDDTSFERITKFARATAGLSIAPSKSAMVRTRLARRLRLLKLDSYNDYCEFILSDEGQSERAELVSALTTNVSHFYRERHHFDLLCNDVLPELLKSCPASQQIRIWSAGCSNGQEPYSLATAILNHFPNSQRDKFKILASDIDPKVVSFAHQGLYPKRMIEGLDPKLRNHFFNRISQCKGETLWSAGDEIRKMISFRKLNLLDAWPMKIQFDAIFCRNVVIYFDQETQDALWQKFAKTLRPGGWLFLGHSERISDIYQDKFETLGGTAYRLR